MTSSVAAAMAPSRSGWLNDAARADTPAEDISLLWRLGAVWQAMVCTHSAPRSAKKEAASAGGFLWGRSCQSSLPCSTCFLLLIAAGDLALDTLHIEIHPTEEFVICHGILGEHFLAGVVHHGALPDDEAAALQ